MRIGSVPDVDCVAAQVRQIRRIHIIFTAMLVISTSVLVITTILGTKLFSPTKKSQNSNSAPLTFDQVNISSPLPILMTHSTNDLLFVQVKGQTVSNPSSNKIKNNYKTDSGELIRSFGYSPSNLAQPETVTISWDTKPSRNDRLYVVYESDGSNLSKDDLELYSLSGRDFESTSQNVVLENMNSILYLKVFESFEKGRFELIGTSQIAKNLR